MEIQVNADDVLETVNKCGTEGGGLIALLDEIQQTYGYLPEEALRLVAETTDRSLVDVYGVATFYRFFSLQPRGKHHVCACVGTACHVRGAPLGVQEFERQLGIKEGQTTPDGEFTLETVNCLGACALGPVTVIDGRYFSKVRTSRVAGLIEEARRGFAETGTEADRLLLPLDVNCPQCNRSLMDKDFVLDGHPAIRLTASFDHQQGTVRLSCVYGSRSTATDCSVPVRAVVTFYCPHCHWELTGTPHCPVCRAPVARLLVRGGGTLRVCARYGCPGRMLDIR